MALSESESVAYGGIKTGSLVQAPQSPHEEATPDQSISCLNKQNSIFSLTLDEIQLKSGKTFGSMNMDEFLANLWNVEENQVPSQLNQNEPINDKGMGSQPTLARQGSFSIPTPLCKKTVDEVWFEIQKELPQQRKANNITDHEPPQRQQTFGEMTLEDFLIKAGVVQEPSGSSQQKKVTPIIQTNGTNLDANYGMGHVIGSSQQKMVTPIQNNNASLDANFGMGHVMGLFPGHQIVANNLATAGNGYAAAYPIFTESKIIMGESSNGAKNGSGTNSLLEPAVLHKKKRIIDGPPEVVVERRQRRMIKNRESAARSRARKQAYTVELELELNQLKQENAKLKQLVEENEQRRKQEVLKRKQSTHTQRKVDRMRTLRRTVSLGW
ncbi:Basic-leucine zipper transcription factor family protein, putative [Theobroma cacao]|uniref:Basic-leucine zipper transcription factor family protein, putative n=1 Tax=Theobroma cacao TaxID=3641 RepID=A0A061GVK6_THECC|nr:Basic-leucine zipper transcription factor family protein, putative [Theobroma cacao]